MRVQPRVDLFIESDGYDKNRCGSRRFELSARLRENAGLLLVVELKFKLEQNEQGFTHKFAFIL